MIKPEAYLHYFIGGYPPDGYSEESELIMPHDFDKYEAIENNEAEGFVPLYAIPEGYALVPIEPLTKTLESHIENTRELRSNHMASLGFSTEKNKNIVMGYNEDVADAELLLVSMTKAGGVK